MHSGRAQHRPRRPVPAPRAAQRDRRRAVAGKRTSTGCWRRSWSRRRTSRNADGGTLYRVTDERTLKFEIMRNDSLGIAMGGTTGDADPVLSRSRSTTHDGEPMTSMVAAYAVHHDQSVNIADAYTEEGFDFSGTQEFRQEDRLSLAVVPHGADEEPRGRDHRRAAAHQRQGPRRRGEVGAFSDADQRLAESLASQAAIALTNRLLINQLEELFESFIDLINAAIDDKSPYTGGHCAARADAHDDAGRGGQRRATSARSRTSR